MHGLVGGGRIASAATITSISYDITGDSHAARQLSIDAHTGDSHIGDSHAAHSDADNRVSLRSRQPGDHNQYDWEGPESQ
jgi:hypothetical protein